MVMQLELLVKTDPISQDSSCKETSTKNRLFEYICMVV